MATTIILSAALVGAVMVGVEAWAWRTGRTSRRWWALLWGAGCMVFLVLGLARLP